MTHSTDGEQSFEPSATWYSDAQSYWSGVSATVDGMLGGYARVDALDAAGSSQFIQRFLHDGDMAGGHALGIGRVTKSFLSKHFVRVDLVEQEARFIATARADPELASVVERFIHSGLQDLQPTHGRYDLVWCQWVLGHLTDHDLVQFLERCGDCVDGRRGALVCVKENVGTRVAVDREDSSVTRSESVWQKLFHRARLEIVHEAWQPQWPSGLYRVKMWALSRPE